MAKKLNITLIISTVLALTTIFALLMSKNNLQNPNVKAADPMTRGTSGDLWADLQVGKRDFAEIGPREVVAYKVSSPGGVVIDSTGVTDKMYVWDSANSRILGLDVPTCLAGTGPCVATLVIGQPSLNDYGACNLDSSFSNYPTRAPASASTLCGVDEATRTTLEDKSFTSMYVDDQGALYVADIKNHRVLKYNNPFATDSVADEVWGQGDFTGNLCNRGSVASASTLCFFSINSSGNGGVTFDGDGNMWIADGGNNRVLRFLKNQSTGVISKTADIVLGQASMAVGGDWSTGTEAGRMNGPQGMLFDADGNLYVADTGNNRVLKFSPPFVNGMNYTSLFGTNFNGPTGLFMDRSLLLHVFDTQGWDSRITQWNLDGTLKAELPRFPHRGGGSIAKDRNGNLYASTYVYGQDVHSLMLQPDGSYVRGKDFFSPPGGFNLTTFRRLEHPDFVGVAVAGNQLVVSDGRLLFYNNAQNLVNGQDPNGFMGAASATTIPNPGFREVKSDSQSRLWAARRIDVQIFQGPFVSGQAPFKTLTSPLSVLGGGSLAFDNIQGIAVTPQGDYVWLSEPTSHRVFRVKNPLTNPVVDVILGQTSATDTQCNRGLVVPPNQNPGRPATQDATLNMLCFPGALALDTLGNLFVSDHYLESDGNWRLLMFSSSTFSTTSSTVQYAPNATKEFPRQTSTNADQHMTFEPAFDSKNRMVVGQNPYSGKRFVEYFLNPTSLNSSNPSDPAYARADGTLKDYYGWAVGATFDSFDNLFVYDANRGHVLFYKTPFANLTQATSIPSPTPTRVPTVLPSPTKLPTPTPSPVPSPTVKPTVTQAPTPTAPAILTLTPSGYTMNTGTYASGTVSNLNTNDGAFFSTKSTTSGTNRKSVVDVTYSGGSTTGRTKISLALNLASTVNTTYTQVFLFNNRTSQWVQVDAFNSGKNQTSRTVNVTSNIQDYVNASGIVKVRASSQQDATHTMNYDRIQVQILK